MAIKVMCPICKKRLFDIRSKASGKIQLKCPHCRKLILLELGLELNHMNY